MFKNQSRSIRRHHITRLKKKRANYRVFNWWSSCEAKRRLGLIVATPKNCSCPACGNPRKWWNQKSIQELKHEQIESEDYNESKD